MSIEKLAWVLVVAGFPPASPICRGAGGKPATTGKYRINVSMFISLLHQRGGEIGGVRYQGGPLARLLTPGAVLAYVRAHVREPAEPMVVFTGTLPLLTDGFRPAAFFAVELTDPRRNRSLRCEYAVRVLDYLV